MSSTIKIDMFKTGLKETDIEKAVAKRLEHADTNHDGVLDQTEITSLVKDLVYEHRSQRRLLCLSVTTFCLLVFSLAANFGLLIWAQELSKESHVDAMAEGIGDAVADAASGSRRRLVHGAAYDRDSFMERMKAMRGERKAMTGTDKKGIVQTKEATEEMPLYVMAAADKEKLETGPKSVTFDVYDYDQKAKGTKDRPNVKTKTMAVEEVEQISPTHVKFKGKEPGEYVEVKDGKTYAAQPKTTLNNIMESPAFKGSKKAPMGVMEAPVGKTTRESKDTIQKPPIRSYAAPDLKEWKDKAPPLVQPVCGSPTVNVKADGVDVGKEMAALEEEAIARLEARGINVKDKRDQMFSRGKRRRRLQEFAELPADMPDEIAARIKQMREEMMKPPAVFDGGCGDAVKEVLAPAVNSLSVATKEAAKIAESAECDEEKNPACYACTDSILGCQPIEIEHDGKLADQMLSNFFATQGAKPVKKTPNAPVFRRQLQATMADVKKSKLFVSEPIGHANADESDTQEIFLADEGICGVKAKGDDSMMVSAIAFRGCDSTSWSDFYGVEGRAIEMATETADARQGWAAETANAFGKQPVDMASQLAVADETSRSFGADALEGRNFSGLEGLTQEWVDDGFVAFDGFSATVGAGVSSLTLTRAANFTDNYAASAGIAATVTLGNGEGRRFPLPRYKPPTSVADTAPPTIATLGTRLVGAVVRSDVNLKSIAWIYKDDCAKYIEYLEDYKLCKAQIQATMAAASTFPTDEALKESGVRLRR